MSFKTQGPTLELHVRTGFGADTDMWGRSHATPRDQRDGGRALVTFSLQPCAASCVTLLLSSHA